MKQKTEIKRNEFINRLDTIFRDENFKQQIKDIFKPYNVIFEEQEKDFKKNE